MTGMDGRMDAELDVAVISQSSSRSPSRRWPFARRRDLAMDRAGPRPEQKVAAARSNRQQTPDRVAPASSAHSYWPALLLAHNYNQLPSHAVPV